MTKLLVLKIIDHFFSQEAFSLEQTNTKGLYKTSPLPSKEIISNYYNSQDYLSHNTDSKSFFSFVYNFAKTVNAIIKWRIIKEHIQTDKLCVDYGCGVGDFAAFVKNKGVDVIGFEPNEDAAKMASHKIGRNTKSPDFFKNLENESVGTIMLWHVLEHVYDLEQTIDEIDSKLEKNGTLIVALPNHSSFDAKYYKEFWAAWDVPRHIHHFSKNSVCEYFNSNGFKVLKIRPLILDAYYISILSERYKKTGLFGVFRALFVATISNFKAIFSGNYSSLVFVLKKANELK